MKGMKREKESLGISGGTVRMSVRRSELIDRTDGTP
jgi:hypothetical protein